MIRQKGKIFKKNFSFVFIFNSLYLDSKKFKKKIKKKLKKMIKTYVKQS